MCSFISWERSAIKAGLNDSRWNDRGRQIIPRNHKTYRVIELKRKTAGTSQTEDQSRQIPAQKQEYSELLPVAELPWAEELGLVRATERCFSSQRVHFASTTEKLHKAHLMA